MTEVLLRAQGLGKAFPSASNPRERLGALLRVLSGRPVASRWAVRDVSFEIAPGASLGVIGENGAGKSTLLKLLTGVLTPSAGSMQRTGSVGALLELGAGFDNERSGRENIALSAGLMGWTDQQVREREAEIIEFADIGEYIDAPVKHYSSGMVVRLGFAIIAAVRPTLLITDEVLAVGDESFQRKCIRWMDSYLADGGTLLLVSHSMYHVQKLCKTALWLRHGEVEAYGEVFDVTQDYLAYHERLNESNPSPQALDQSYDGADFRITEVVMNGETAEQAQPLNEDAELELLVTVYSPDQRIPPLCFGLVRADGTAVFGSTTEVDAAPFERLGPHHVRYRLQFELGSLLPGQYAINLHAMDPEAFRLFDTVVRGFIIRGKTREVGLVRVPHRWL